MTIRERREAKAERLRLWAEKRDAKATAGFNVGEQYRGDTAFWTQPGRIPERERVFAAHVRAGQDAAKSDDMESRARGIERQLARTIYDDDPDAAERFAERIAKMEHDRDSYKAIGAALRKSTAFDDLPAGLLSEKSRASYARWQAEGGGVPSYVRTNLGSEIRRYKARLEALGKPKPMRIIYARRDGDCVDCTERIRGNNHQIAEVEPGTWVHLQCAVKREQAGKEGAA